jgi:hypothetical protein
MLTQNDLLNLELKYKNNEEVLGLIHLVKHGYYAYPIPRPPFTCNCGKDLERNDKPDA